MFQKRKSFTLQEILLEIDKVRAKVQTQLARFPDFHALQTTLDGLDAYETAVHDQWPLSDQFQNKVTLGVFAARNLDEIDNGMLTRAISSLDAMMHGKV
ncbi:MAG: hypothetical protein HQM15_05425 [Deltaproteobacteria bacterium]|nr:hypothetical protein [Deltaproteobacteria bacterium]